jgi:hypothetical protein
MSKGQDKRDRTIADLEYRIKRLEYVILKLQNDSRVYMGICQDAQCGRFNHPHWEQVPAIDFSKPVIYT